MKIKHLLRWRIAQLSFHLLLITNGDGYLFFVTINIMIALWPSLEATASHLNNWPNLHLDKRLTGRPKRNGEKLLGKLEIHLHFRSDWNPESFHTIHLWHIIFFILIYLNLCFSSFAYRCMKLVICLKIGQRIERKRQLRPVITRLRLSHSHLDGFNLPTFQIDNEKFSLFEMAFPYKVSRWN